MAIEKVTPGGAPGPSGAHAWHGAGSGQAGPAGPGSSPAGFDDDVTVADVVRMLRRHPRVMAGVTLAVVVVVAAWIYTRPAVYRADAVVQVTDVRQELTGVPRMAPQGRSGADPLVTQLQVLQSRSVVGAVVDGHGLRVRAESDELDLAELGPISVDAAVPPGPLRLWFDEQQVVAATAGDTVAAWYGQPFTVGGIRMRVPRPPSVGYAALEVVPREDAIDYVTRMVDARLRPETSIIDVTYRSRSPERARVVVNAVVEQYAEHSARTAQDESRRRRIFLEEQLAQVDSLLAVAQAALTEFRSSERVYSSQQQGVAQQSGLLDLQMRREELAADRGMYRSLLDALTRSSGSERRRQIRTMVSAPGIAGNPVIAQLYSQMIRYELARDSLVSGEWGSAPSNPDVERLEGLLESTRYQLVDAVHSHIEAVDARLAALDELQDRTAAELQALPALEAREARLVQQVETVRQTAEQLRREHQEARLAEAIETGDVEIIDIASRAVPVDDRRTLKLGLGLALGLMLGAGLAFVLETMNTSVRTREDVERMLGLSPLGVVPRLQLAHAGRIGGLAALPGRRRRNGHHGANGNGAAAVSRELVTVHDNRSSAAEAYRTLRTNLLFSQMGDRLRSVLVTSAGAGEGKTTVAANLATTFAQQGVRVLLVDADLRKARVHRVFGIEREPGLTEWLIDRADAAEAIRETDVPGLSVLPAGQLPPNPSELLGSPRMRALLETLRDGFELVLFDTPPLLAAGDAAILGARTDGVVLVTRAGETEQDAAREAVRQLRNVGARILGGVLNDPDARASRYGEYYHYEYYGDKA